MTKEIQVEGENTTRIASQELDSLIAKYQIIDDKSSEAAKLIQNQIMIRNRDLQKLQENYFKSSNSKITQRLNTYLKNYAEEHDYQLILGSNVLYSNKLIDKTQEAIIFINQKYDGL
jgi:Skp family chaperone for outer membrane proteins